MKITINGSPLFKNLIGTLYHDIDGNILLMINDISTEHKYYFLTIDSFDNLEWVFIENFNNLPSINKSHNLKFKNIKNSNSKYSLKGKIIDDIVEEEDEDDEYYANEESNEYKIRYKYFPEEKYYNDDSDGNQSDDDHYTEKCNFSKIKDDIDDKLLCLDRTLDTISSYDTVLMDNINKMILKTIQSNSNNHYKILIFLNGLMELNIIGSSKKSYELKYSYASDGLHVFSQMINKNIVL